MPFLFIEVYAFSRGERIVTGIVLNQRVDRFIEGGKSETFALNLSGVRTWDIDLAGLEDAP